MTDNDYSEADYEEAYGILDDGYEKWSTQYDEVVSIDDERIDDALYFFDEMEEMDYWDDFYHYFNEEN